MDADEVWLSLRKKPGAVLSADPLLLVAGGVHLFFHTLLPENHQNQLFFLRISIKMCDSPAFLHSKVLFFMNNCTLVWKLLHALVESCFLLGTLYRCLVLTGTFFTQTFKISTQK